MKHTFMDNMRIIPCPGMVVEHTLTLRKSFVWPHNIVKRNSFAACCCHNHSQSDVFPRVCGTNPVYHHDVLRGPLAGIVPNIVRYRLSSPSIVGNMTFSLAGVSTVLQEHAFISVVLHFMSHGDAAVVVETASVRRRTRYRSGFPYIGTESTTTSDKC